MALTPTERAAWAAEFVRSLAVVEPPDTFPPHGDEYDEWWDAQALEAATSACATVEILRRLRLKALADATGLDSDLTSILLDALGGE